MGEVFCLTVINYPNIDIEAICPRPTGQPNPKDLAENRRFQGFLKEILEIDNRANLRFARNLVDFNTLVLKSRCFRFSEISDEISEEILRIRTIF